MLDYWFEYWFAGTKIKLPMVKEEPLSLNAIFIR